MNKEHDYKKECEELKKQLEEYQLQNIDLRADIMIQKKSFPNKEIKDKTFYDLYDMPTYEELNKKLNEAIHKATEFESEVYELKKQLEKKYSKTGTLTNEVLYEENTKLINQQKEFIEYLEDMLDDENDIFSVARVKDVLRKYKEITGTTNE